MQYTLLFVGIVKTAETLAIAHSLGGCPFRRRLSRKWGHGRTRRLGRKLLIGAVLVFLVTIGFSLSDLTTVQMLTGGGPVNASMVLPLASYQWTFQYLRMGTGAAAQVCLAILLTGCAILVWLVAQRSGLAISLSGKGVENERDIPKPPAAGTALSWISVVVFFVFVLVLFIGPILYTILGSFKVEKQLMTSPLSLIPAPFTLGNYTTLLSQLDVAPSFFLPLTFVIPSLVLQLAVSLLGGYALGRLRFAGRGVFFFLVCAGVFVGPAVFSQSLFFDARSLGIINTYIPLVFAWAGCPIGILLCTLFFRGQRIDAERGTGTDSDLRSMARAFVSDTIRMAAFTAVVLLLAMMKDILVPLVLLNNSSLFTLGLHIFQLSGGMVVRRGVLDAILTIGMVPTLLLALVFLFLQRGFFTRVRILMPGLRRREP